MRLKDKLTVPKQDLKLTILRHHASLLEPSPNAVSLEADFSVD